MLQQTLLLWLPTVQCLIFQIFFFLSFPLRSVTATEIVKKSKYRSRQSLVTQVKQKSSEFKSFVELSIETTVFLHSADIYSRETVLYNKNICIKCPSLL